MHVRQRFSVAVRADTAITLSGLVTGPTKCRTGNALCKRTEHMTTPKWDVLGRARNAGIASPSSPSSALDMVLVGLPWSDTTVSQLHSCAGLALRPSCVTRNHTIAPVLVPATSDLSIREPRSCPACFQRSWSHSSRPPSACFAILYLHTRRWLVWRTRVMRDACLSVSLRVRIQTAQRWRSERTPLSVSLHLFPT